MRRWLALVLLVGAAVPMVPIAVASTQASALALSIVHTVRGCHIWSTGAKALGPATTISVKPGTRLKIRASCPMDFELRQTAGPKLALGGSRLYTGTTRTIVFRKAGLYRLVAKNVQTSDEIGLETLGEDNLPAQAGVRVR
jgi:hypothetical protein